MTYVSSTQRRRPSLTERFGAWVAGWAKALAEAKAHAEMTHKLRGLDDHLLRDMGLTWTGTRFERDAGDEDCQR